MKRHIFYVQGMHCASCVQGIENSLRTLKGIKRVRADLLSGIVYVEYEEENVSISEIKRAIKEKGYCIKEGESDDKIVNVGRKFIYALFFAVPLFYFSMGVHWGLPIPYYLHKWLPVLQFIFATPIMFLGKEFYYLGVKAIFKDRQANMDTLITLSTASAYIYSIVISLQLLFRNEKIGEASLYYEIAGFLMFFVLLGRYLEATSKARSTQAVEKLLSLQSKNAHLIRDGKEIDVPLEEVKVGDVLLVKPGERVPVDGLIIEGFSLVDESLITGESIPKEKKEGDRVTGGTLNTFGSFKMKATEVGEDTFLFKIALIMGEAQGRKAPLQEIADKVSAYFVPGVVLISFITFLVWYFLTKEVNSALLTSISVLIIACPCALGLATPIVIAVASGLGAVRGILFKSGRAIQMLSQVGIFVFDKTGTLTEGKPEVTDIIPFNGFSVEDVLFYASIAESESEHPLARAIINKAQEKGISPSYPDKFNYHPGKGIEANFKGKYIVLGNEEILNEIKDREFLIEVGRGLEEKGRTVLYLLVDREQKGIIALSDKLKEEAEEVLRKLKTLGRKVMILSGDNEQAAEAVGRRIKVDNVIARVTPEDKARIIRELKREGKVAMVGDGVNDAVALAEADLGIAMEVGSDLTAEAGDIVILGGNLRRVLQAIQISSLALKKIKQNLFWAFFYNLIGISIATGLWYPIIGLRINPLMAGLAMIFSDLVVVPNSLLMGKLLREDAPKEKQV